MRKSPMSYYICAFYLLCTALCFASFGDALALGDGEGESEQAPPVRPDDYPELNAKELGHLRYALHIADQEIDDFTLIPLTDLYGIPGSGRQQKNMSSARYTLAFMTYFLALEQFHKLPQYTALIQPRMDRLIQKMLHPKVWGYWADTSRGTSYFEPNLDRPYPSEKNPVAQHNIMYSGHLAHMLMLYEKLYQDSKYSQPRAVTFWFDAYQHAAYDSHSLIKILYDNFLSMPEHCHQCERNACFPVCNQHPLLALLLHDQLYGSRYFPEVRSLLVDWYQKYDLIDPLDHTVAAVLLLKQDEVLAKRNPKLGNRLDHLVGALNTLGFLGTYSAAIDGWNGLFMNTWAPEVVRYHYPFQVQNSIVRQSETVAYTKRHGLYDQISAPFFAAMAAELGDLKLRDQLLAWSDERFQGRFSAEGHYHYATGMEIPVPLIPGFRVKGLPMTDKLAGLARANVQDGMRRMHLEPFAGGRSDYPRVGSVSAGLDVSRAVFDPKKQALIVSLVPAGERPGTHSTVKISQLKSSPRWRLWLDRLPASMITTSGELVLTLTSNERHDLVLAAAPATLSH